MSIQFNDQVAIVTGAGAGLGRAHALALAAHGAKVIVNDLGAEAAESVVAEICAAGGEAMADNANVAEFDQVQAMVGKAMEAWGRVDVLVNNAGILRDKTFAKMPLEDFKAVLDVHLYGSVHCTKAVWDIMREQNYGRIVMTTSSSGLYGNFGQSNYGAAKMALVGFMNTLVLEGHKYNIRVNCLSPTAGTAMTEGLIEEQAFELLSPESVSPALLVLCCEDSPNRLILCAGAGAYAAAHVYETQGVYLPPAEQTPDQVMAHLDQINDREGEQELIQGFMQTHKFVGQAMAALDSNA
jgi:NAD(P)-dependent dehydrogenase (short-subunit alcohol dehydrogenase family)